MDRPIRPVSCWTRPRCHLRSEDKGQGHEYATNDQQVDSCHVVAYRFSYGGHMPNVLLSILTARHHHSVDDAAITCSAQWPTLLIVVTKQWFRIVFSRTDLRYVRLMARQWCLTSVCLSSVTFVYPTQTVKLFSNIFSPYGSPIILGLPASNIFTKFRRGQPLRGR